MCDVEVIFYTKYLQPFLLNLKHGMRGNGKEMQRKKLEDSIKKVSLVYWFNFSNVVGRPRVRALGLAELN